jgi:hypothetical protein
MEVTILVKELLLNLSKRLEEGLVISVVQAADEQCQWAKVNGHLSLGLLSAGAECGQIDSSSRLRWLRAVAIVSAWTSAEGTAKSKQLVLSITKNSLDLGCINNLGLEIDTLKGD